MTHFLWLIPAVLFAFAYGFWKGAMFANRVHAENEAKEGETPKVERFKVEIGVMQWKRKDRNRFLGSQN